MKAYLITTAAVFGLLPILHIWRMLDEGMQLGRDPGFLLITVASAALCVWACRLLRLAPK